jgi:parallel beta-helix repeat protein
VYSGGFGIYTSSNCLVDNCTAAFCANGISCPSSTVRGCEVSNCSQSGIQVTSNCVVVRNSLVGNNSSGTGNLGGLVATASGNRIEGNSFVGNGNAGLYISGGAGPHVTGNLIVGNSFSGTLYIVDAGNTIGPLVNMASGGGVITSTNPWANIAY